MSEPPFDLFVTKWKKNEADDIKGALQIIGNTIAKSRKHSTKTKPPKAEPYQTMGDQVLRFEHFDFEILLNFHVDLPLIFAFWAELTNFCRRNLAFQNNSQLILWNFTALGSMIILVNISSKRICPA